MLPPSVTDKLDALPTQPGVYVFKDRAGAVLYIGKAKSLRSRVRSYFQAGSSDVRSFIPLLLEAIGDIETIVVENEREALILENSLIKEQRPKYNVKLRDDKEYLSIRLPLADEWPRLYLVRRPEADAARYFGPYHSATAARRTLHLINKHFQLRTCTDADMRARKRPCLQYQIKRCPGPCVFEVDREFYAQQVRHVTQFLEGRHDELSTELRARMAEAVKSLSFELAAVYRDQLVAIDKVKETQRIISEDGVDRDVIGLHRDGDAAELSLLHVRGGRLSDVRSISVKNVGVPDDELIGAFLSQHYAQDPEGDSVVPVPQEVLVPALPEVAAGVQAWLSERAGHKVALLSPQRGARALLLAMAQQNAMHSYVEKRRAETDIDERLAQIQQKLRLPSVPRRFECCDISHLGGGDTVGAIVSFWDGQPDKKRYRTYHVKTAGAGARAAALAFQHDAADEDAPTRTPALGDDYAAMYEVLSRRFRRGRDTKSEGADNGGTDGEWELPDLFVVDGGRGQLGVALAAARDLGLHDLAIVGLAKEKENVAGETVVDRVYVPGQKNPIAVRGTGLVLLARARDEAHRFANKGRTTKGKARQFRSALDEIRGIGPATKKALLRALGSLQAIRSASDDSLLAVPGVTRRHVAALRKALPPSLPTDNLVDVESQQG
jgi:excinuclease ABC subunit C